MTFLKKNSFHDPLTILIAAWMLLFFYMVCHTYIVGPFYDDWHNMYFLRKILEGNFDLASLFERFYGAHTVVISRLLFALEYFVFKGTNIFPKFFSFVVTSLTLVIFISHIKKTDTSEKNKKILIGFGFIAIFNMGQLYAFSYTWGCFQHTGAILFSFLAIHVFVSDVQKNIPVTANRIFIYLSLCTVASLFTATGLFAVGAIFLGLIIQRVPHRMLALYVVGLLAMAYFFRPDDTFIMRAEDSTNITAKMDMLAYMNKLGIAPRTFFPGFFTYFFGYMGSIAAPFPLKIMIWIGVVFFLVFVWVFVLAFLSKKSNLLFFQLVLIFLLGHAIISALGRYETGDDQYQRYVSIYFWLVWAGCVLALIQIPRVATLLLCFVFSALMITAYPNIKTQLRFSQEISQADINMINNSFIHLTYSKTSIQHKLFNFKPEYFRDMQKKRSWGIYQFPFNPDLSRINNNKCDMTKIHEFIVSEKKFVEYKLDGWNATENKALDYVYALDQNNAIVAYGISMARQPSVLPLFMLPREKVMVYIVIPRQYRLTDLKFIGGEKNDYCEVTYESHLQY